LEVEMWIPHGWRSILKMAWQMLWTRPERPYNHGPELLALGSPVWVRRGGGAALGRPGCTRIVRGTLLAVEGNEAVVRLDEDDPFDTVGWNTKDDVGRWGRSVVTRRLAHE